jgi:hypothetical protein
MNEQTFHHNAQAPNKGGPFLSGLKARGILGRFGEHGWLAVLPINRTWLFTQQWFFAVNWLPRPLESHKKLIYSQPVNSF